MIGERCAFASSMPPKVRRGVDSAAAMTDHVLNAETGRYGVTGYDVQFYVHQAKALIKHTQTLATMCAERDAGDEQAALFVARLPDGGCGCRSNPD